MAPPPPTSETPRASGSTAPSNCLLSSAFRHLPFSHPLPPPKPSVPDHTASDRAPRPLSPLSAAERFLRSLGAAVSGHPLLKPFLSLHSDLRIFLQVRCGNHWNHSMLKAHGFAAILPGDSVAGLVVANGITNFLNIYNTLLVVRLVLTWFPNSPPAIVSPLSTLCDPYLNIFRGIIPPLGGTLDLSPILAFIVLNVFTSTAAALPAELPVTTTTQQNTLSHPMTTNLTTTQEKWMRRICRKRSRNSEDVS
ncbi:ylmG homolog protein 2, chloroplastic-like [Elaeis guineensis]|uniref:YlmG homolog protein 2, chloroplastic n=1 Tax=Elaeis guineensis var. tenera TaxID=51953 RepID=A0A6I9SAF3_ELAGV|nr:ylmG homolog protein 2, chloroplastic [Elaeis guineensis]